MRINRWAAYWLRRIADRIDYHGAPRAIGPSFTFEHGEGIRFRDDGRGCPLWYLGEDDYERAHTEADTRHVRVDWKAQPLRADYVGGGRGDSEAATRGWPA